MNAFFVKKEQKMLETMNPNTCLTGIGQEEDLPMQEQMRLPEPTGLERTAAEILAERARQVITVPAAPAFLP
jgi:hypothetical protein